jgi:hypothetical protein
MDAHTAGPRRNERVIFETDRHLIVGDLTLPGDGYQSRLSDAVNRGDVHFLPLLDVEVSPLGGGNVHKHPFLLLAKAHVRIVRPMENGSEQPGLDEEGRALA